MFNWNSFVTGTRSINNWWLPESQVERLLKSSAITLPAMTLLPFCLCSCLFTASFWSTILCLKHSPPKVPGSRENAWFQLLECYPVLRLADDEKDVLFFFKWQIVFFFFFSQAAVEKEQMDQKMFGFNLTECAWDTCRKWWTSRVDLVNDASSCSESF